MPVVEVSDFDKAIGVALDHVLDRLLSHDNQLGLALEPGDPEAIGHE